MTTQFSFQAQLVIDGELVPISTEVTTGAANTSGGVENGFIFTLDYQPGDAPVTVSLGSIIGLIEDKLGAGSLARNPNFALIEQAFPTSIPGPGAFSSASPLVIAIRAFTLNSSTTKTLFSISIDVSGSDPTVGLIPLPAQFASWLRVETVAISFTATSTNTVGGK